MMKRFAVIIAFLIFAVNGSRALADCNISPSGSRPEGAIVYNSDYNVLQYCTGTEWKAIVWNAASGGECFNTWAARDSDRFWYDIASSDDGMKLAATTYGDKIQRSDRKSVV